MENRVPPTTTSTPKVQQPTPQALPTRKGPTTILVSPRQKGNPILNHIQSVPWEYSDIPADYVLGATTCALFLSLKYHRLHPEYIYTRIRGLAGKYNLRVALAMVDIPNHEDPLKELSKTSLINNLTLILCWSAAEAGRYLSLFKSYEHASPSSIRSHQATGFSDKLVEFITVPRSINKTDAIALVSNFGTLRAAINAGPEEIALVSGWGEKKVQRWCSSVREGFRVSKAKKRGLPREGSRPELLREGSSMDSVQESAGTPRRDGPPPSKLMKEVRAWEQGSDDDEALLAAAEAEAEIEVEERLPDRETAPATTSDEHVPSVNNGATGDIDPALPSGVRAALARLREKG
ncbi:MAG: ssDNA endonuclease and repair protein rad10 [Piccolia ochrophora]|nr:MAG: ssDNA endonuclease and repair protein rad10 [Piccolia ochrophora]